MQPAATQNEAEIHAAPVLSVVIPLYNEAAHIESTLPVIVGELDELLVSYEVVLIDDGSSDATWAKICLLGERYPIVRGVRLSRNFGKEGAISAGLRHAQGAAVAVMDCDLQHPPALLKQMLEIWREGNTDVIEAVKVRRRDESLLRKLGGRAFNAIYTQLTGYNLDEATDYKLLDRRVVDEFLKLGETRIFYRGMIAWLGFRHTSIGFEVPAGVGRRSVWSLKSLAMYALTSLTAFTAAPLHVVTLLGVITLVFSFLLGAWTIYLYLSNNALAGFSTVIVVQLFGNSIIMLSLGVIGEYLGSIYQETKRRPRFIVSETVGKQNQSVHN